VIGILPSGDKIGNMKPLGDRMLIKVQCDVPALMGAGGGAAQAQCSSRRVGGTPPALTLA
jgi:hypothetical protein